MERAGRGGRPAVLGPYNPLDYGTGAMAGLAATLGLYHRARTGEGQHVWTSLAQTGTFHQATLLIDHPAAVWDEPAGREALGSSELQRFYRGADAWFFVGASTVQRSQLASAVGVDASFDAPALEAAFAARPAADWVSELIARGIGAQQVVRLPELLDEPEVAGTGLSVRQLSVEVGEVVLPGPAVHVDGRRLAAAHVASAPGTDARDVLAELGREAELRELEARWVVQSEPLISGWA